MDLSRFIKRAAPLGPLGVIITQHGSVVAEHHWDDDMRRNIYSASKSFTAMAVGIALREGLLSLSEKIVDVFPDALPEDVSENLAAATLRDCLTMGLGQDQGWLMGEQRPRMRETDWVRYALEKPFLYRPGSRFVYNNVGPYLAGLVVQMRAGCDLLAYLGPRLLTPMGIRRTVWEVDPQGRTFGAGGMFLSMEELNKLGLLMLNKGRWNGRQLVPEEWVAACTTRQIDNGSYGYGYLFWAGPEETWRADGKYGQWSIVHRRKDAVVTLTAECRDTEALMNAVSEELFPLLG